MLHGRDREAARSKWAATGSISAPAALRCRRWISTTGLYRPSTLADLHDFTRLQDTLTNVSWFTRCCVATDVPDNFDLDVNTAYALLRNTTKPVATSFTLAEHVAPIVEMLDIAAGGPGEFAKAPVPEGAYQPGDLAAALWRGRGGCGL